MHLQRLLGVGRNSDLPPTSAGHQLKYCPFQYIIIRNRPRLQYHLQKWPWVGGWSRRRLDGNVSCRQHNCFTSTPCLWLDFVFVQILNCICLNLGMYLYICIKSNPDKIKQIKPRQMYSFQHLCCCNPGRQLSLISEGIQRLILNQVRWLLSGKVLHRSWFYFLIFTGTLAC